jgi:hypothetical protein
MDLRYYSSFNDKKERGNMELKEAQTFLYCRLIGGTLCSLRRQVSMHIVQYMPATQREERHRERKGRCSHSLKMGLEP